MAGKQFISVKKATALTGKPERKMVKWCEKHRDTKYIRFEDGLYKIRFDFLREQFGDLNEESTALSETEPVYEPVPAASHSAEDSLLEVLKEQVAEKDRQLSAKDAHISQLIERNREQNNIIFSLEQHKQLLEAKLSIALPEQKPEKPFVPEIAAVPAKPSATNYAMLAITIILSGVLLIIFYALLLA